ncbi:MAG: SulP family inorganic anion transporter [Verrucomicrobiota bacterium]
MSRSNFWRIAKAPISGVSGFSQLDFFPIRHQVKGYNSSKFSGDLRAGINVALLAFPQGIAYALIAGLPIYYGIFGSAIAAILGPIFSRGHFIVLGPTNATSVLLMSTFVGLAAVEDRLTVVPLLVILAGVFLIIGAYLRLASFIQFISRTVVTGYITAAALLITLNQVKNALGFKFDEDEKAKSFVMSLYYTGLHLKDTHLPSLLLSIITFGVYFGISRKLPKLPNVAITLLVMSFVATLFAPVGLTDLAFLNAVSAAEWKFTPPSLDLGLASTLLSGALAIALLSVLEGTSIGKSLAARSGSRLDTNQEMFSMGVSNIGCGLFSGMPASGSLTRSVLNINSGARTSLASIYSGIIVAVAAVTIGFLVRYIPQASLAVLIICIGISLINTRNIRLVLQATRSDAAVFIATLLTGLLLGLDSAIYVGTGLSIMLFLRQAAHPELVEYQFNEEGQLAEKKEESERSMPEVSIVHVEGDLFFGASDLFRDQMRRTCDDPNLRIVILRMKNARLLDASSVMALDELITYMNEKGRTVVVSGVKKEIYRVFRDSGLIERIGRENIFRESIANPTLSTANAIKRAQEILGNDNANVTIYVDPSKATKDE